VSIPDVPTASLATGLLSAKKAYSIPELVDDGGNVVSKVLYVFSAGNETLNIGAEDIIKVPGEPLQSVIGKNVLFVGATNDPFENACFSNYGTPVVEMWAPGVGWEGLTPAGMDTKDGTSFAAPAVAGVAALALSSGASGLVGQPAALHDWLIDRRRPIDVEVIVQRCGDVVTTCLTQSNQPFINASAAVLDP
jgi:subtilisin family serine protease